MLGNGLYETERYEDALSVFEASIDAALRSSNWEENILNIRIHIARCYDRFGRLEESAAILREVYAREKVLLGTSHVNSLITGRNLIFTLIQLKHYVEAKALARRELVPRSRRTLGSEHEITLGIQDNYAEALFTDPTASRADILQAVAMLEDVAIAYRRILGKHHPDTAHALADLDRARMRYEDVAAP